MPECSLVPKSFSLFPYFCSTIELNPHLPFEFLLDVEVVLLDTINLASYCGVCLYSHHPGIHFALMYLPSVQQMRS